MSIGDNAQEDPIDMEQARLLMKEVRELARALEGTATSRLRIAVGSIQVEIDRAEGSAVTSPTVGTMTPAATSTVPATPGTIPVVAPLVGVVYRAPSPGAKPFVEVGDTVERGQTVCIVEAMKVMNEVVSDFRGTVVEILVENGEAVQYEQPLMMIDISA